MRLNIIYILVLGLGVFCPMHTNATCNAGSTPVSLSISRSGGSGYYSWPGRSQTFYVTSDPDVEMEDGNFVWQVDEDAFEVVSTSTSNHSITVRVKDDAPVGVTGIYCQYHDSNWNNVSLSQYGYCQASAAVRIVKINITDIVQRYYADSDSWCPYKFEVLGTNPIGTQTPANVKIVSGWINLYDAVDDTEVEDVEVELSSCNSENEFILKPQNGTANEYLGVIDAGLFDQISTYGMKVPAKYKLVDVCIEINGTTIGPMSSELSSVVELVDDTKKVIEIYENDYFDHADVKYGQNLLNKSASKGYYVLGRDVDPPTGYPIFKSESQESHLWNYGYDGYSVAYGITSANTNVYYQHSFLETGSDLGVGHVTDARSFDAQRGVYWLVYYNHINSSNENNPFGVQVVGNVCTSSGVATLFPQGQITYKIEETEDEEVINDNLGLASQVLQGLTYLAEATVFGNAISRANDFIDMLQYAADLKVPDYSSDDMGHVYCYKYASIEGPSGTKSVPLNNSILNVAIEDNNQENISCILSSGFNAESGVRMYISTSTYVRLKSRQGGSTSIFAEMSVDLGANDGLEMIWPEPASQANVVGIALDDD